MFENPGKRTVSWPIRFLYVYGVLSKKVNGNLYVNSPDRRGGKSEKNESQKKTSKLQKYKQNIKENVSTPKAWGLTVEYPVFGK